MSALRRILLLTVLPVLVGVVESAGFDRGRALYEHHCRACHEEWAHRRDVRQVDTYEGLRSRVASWSVHAGLDWSAAEVDDVTDFLNRRYYRLPP